MAFADLHSHTTASDGTQSPSDNVRLAAEAGLAAMAVTDHDTVAGLEEARQAGLKYGIAVVPGVEISTVRDGQDIHVLGYWIDYTDPLLLGRLAELRAVRERRNEMILERLRALGLEMTYQDVLDSLQTVKRGDDTIGRPHIADALVRKGYVGTMKEAFDRYLAQGAAAYVNPPRIDPVTAVRWIQEAGGAAVLAHPGLYGLDSLIPELAAQGLAGVEAYHADHTPEQEAHYAVLAAAYGLLVTAGSDFHGERGGVVFHAPIGSCRIGAEITDQLYTRRGVPV
ncbi:PHP domain-containing protein [Paenibacillus filicis]|uniref:PHP domain-containing protein n=1 Tax=Paenibacillus gyeongsangnamensis TaxID=3388067 RepID=A0ABT4Q3J8_9BACL|nr:PHP domain-containing protein [Paenibacillus filicis]MCZ8511409.1 PHP domain-containing protein [Paenibacillus filicis]